MMKKAILSFAGVVAAVLIALPMLQSCGVYSFTGTSIQPDVKTVTINYFEYLAINFINRKYPEEDFENKSFSAYADFDATQSLDAVEASLCEEIIEKLCEDMFNATVANW